MGEIIQPIDTNLPSTESTTGSSAPPQTIDIEFDNQQTAANTGSSGGSSNNNYPGPQAVTDSGTGTPMNSNNGSTVQPIPPINTGVPGSIPAVGNTTPNNAPREVEMAIDNTSSSGGSTTYDSHTSPVRSTSSGTGSTTTTYDSHTAPVRATDTGTGTPATNNNLGSSTYRQNSSGSSGTSGGVTNASQLPPHRISGAAIPSAISSGAMGEFTKEQRGENNNIYKTVLQAEADTGYRVVNSMTTENYTIKPGDTLSEIAKEKYGEGSENAYNTIAGINNRITDPNLIYAGDTIEIPRTTQNNIYDDMGRLIERNVRDVATGEYSTARFEYDDDHNLTKISYLDDNGNVTKTITDPEVLGECAEDLWLDPNGNPTNVKPDQMNYAEGFNPSASNTSSSGTVGGTDHSSVYSAAASFDMSTIDIDDLDVGVRHTVNVHNEIGNIISRLNQLREHAENLQKNFNSPAGSKRSDAHTDLATDFNELCVALNKLDDWIIKTNNQLCDFEKNMGS